MTIFDIQKHLKALGHDPGPIDGVWGSRTRAALLSLLYVLRAIAVPGAASWNVARQRMAAEQAIMAASGFDTGPIDGLDGPRTQAARAQFQSQCDHGLDEAAASAHSEIRQGRARYLVREIVIHTSATRPDWMGNNSLREQVEEIRVWHRARGWRDIGYHWIIGRDGSMLPGRPETEVGAHVQGHNSGTIGICLIGGFGSATTDRFSDHFTARQGITLEQQIQAISMRTPITRVSGHNEYAAKACPGFNVTRWLEGDQ